MYTGSVGVALVVAWCTYRVPNVYICIYTGAFKGFASGLGAVGVALVVGAAIQAHILKSAL
jgi:ABC-type molybdate transport system permease subunit